MIKDKQFETYLYIENNKFKVFLLDTKNLKNIYTNQIIANNNSDIDFDELSKFLDNNIFKIEKLLGAFIEDIFLILNYNKELQTDISIKKKNNNNLTNQKDFNHALVELKEIFNENNKNQEIIHMLIENFIIDRKNHSFFVENIKSEYLNLDVKFITLSDEVILKFNKVLQKYQVQIRKFISGKYLKEFEFDKKIEISQMAHKIIDGHNLNEIEIVPIINENKGFFEKFFQLFS